MKQIRTILILACALLAVASWRPLPAAAHTGAGITAIISLDPATPKPGQSASIKLALTDIYQSPIPAAQMQVAATPVGDSPATWTRLSEDPAGTYSGTIQVPSAAADMLWVQATLLDGLWRINLPFQPGSGAAPLTEYRLMMIHNDAAAPSGWAAIWNNRWIVWAVAGVAFLVWIILLDRRVRRGRKEES